MRRGCRVCTFGTGFPLRPFRPTRYDQLLRRAGNRDYPPALRSSDSVLYARLGLAQRSERATLMLTKTASRAWYDPSARRLLLRRTPAAQRSAVLNELVRALVDQNFNLRRLTGLYAHDRDRALAARGIVDGTAALASGLQARPVSGTQLERFLSLESAARLTGGRQLAAQLRYLGGASALASALRTFPQTTEQLLHVDKFLERERALPVHLPKQIGNLRLTTAETFGELDLRSLLRTFHVGDSVAVAEGWGGGRLALYTSPSGDRRRACVALGHTRGRGRMAERRSRVRGRRVPRRDRSRLPAARPVLVVGVDRGHGLARRHSSPGKRTGV